MRNLKNHAQQTPLKLMVLLFMLAIISSCDSNPYIGKPQNAISVKKAKELSSNFDKRYHAMSEVIGKPDNRSSWHSVKELEQYIAYIKTEGAKKGLAVNGIRIYFGAYDSIPVNKSNLSTLFLVPTVKAKARDQKGVKNFAAVDDENDDTEELMPLNLGSIGQPPSNNY